MNTSRLVKLTSLVWLTSVTLPTIALAVGNGDTFGVNEGVVAGSKQHIFQSDSVDLTYHACSNIISGTPVELNERGYFWLSSFQDAAGVLDSQLNYIGTNGYHIYGVYEFSSERVAAGPGPLGNRRGYQMTDATLALYVDPAKDTLIGLANCQFTYTNTADDLRIGSGSNLLVGEKSEKDGLANGDFQFVLNDWAWNNMVPIVPFSPLNLMTINANLTLLGGPLDADHQPEGSGNIYWRNP